MEATRRGCGSRCGPAPRGQYFRNFLRISSPSADINQGPYDISYHVSQKAIPLDGVDEFFALPGY